MLVEHAHKPSCVPGCAPGVRDQSLVHPEGVTVTTATPWWGSTKPRRMRW
jgi:hypothetical protein